MKKLTLGILALAALMALAAVGCSDKTSLPTESSLRSDVADGKYEFQTDPETDELIPLDGVSIPEVEAELYAQFLESSALPENGKLRETSACSPLNSYWKYAVWREACYALSRTRYLQGRRGQSTRTITAIGGTWYRGDWQYNRSYAAGTHKNCKEFARELVKRATGNRYNLPTGSTYAKGNIAYCQPGDVIQRAAPYEHTAIVFAVLARDRYGRATRIDVIDCNYVASRVIARHLFPWGSWKLGYFRVW